jgi:transposase
VGGSQVGTLEARQAASLAGLAPVARQSGRWTGRAFIRDGRASVRQALYMPALVAARFNPDLKATYTQLVKAGKHAKLALTALMRKLIVLANALLRAHRSRASHGTARDGALHVLDRLRRAGMEPEPVKPLAK